MRRILPLALCLALAAPAVRAEDPATPPSEREGFDLMREGARMFFDGILREMAPAIDEMAGAIREAEPVLRSILALADDIGNYEAPERLPNGDILIRRRPGAPPPPDLPPASDPPDQIEL